MLATEFTVEYNLCDHLSDWELQFLPQPSVPREHLPVLLLALGKEPSSNLKYSGVYFFTVIKSKKL